MDSLFFNITERRYKREVYENYTRVDISNGVLFLQSDAAFSFLLKNLDRMVILSCVKSGKLSFHERSEGKIHNAAESQIYVSSRQNINIEADGEIFILFIADFFLKRYLSGEEREPIDFLYRKLQQEVTLAEINRQPIDALSLYIVEKLLNIGASDRMKSIRAEHLVMEFMIHCFALVDIMDPKISKEDQLLAQRAKAILLKSFVEPPTIKVLAHLCATNETKLKKVYRHRGYRPKN